MIKGLVRVSKVQTLFPAVFITNTLENFHQCVAWSIVSVSINGMSSTWSLNSLLFHKYVGRLVEENTLPLQFLLTFHDTCKSVAKCSRSVSRFRTCGFHLSLPKGSKCGVG